MSVAPTLKGARVTLRAARPEDASARFALGVHADIRRMFGADPDAPLEMSIGQADAWTQAQMANPHAWIIEHEGRLIGAGRLHSIDDRDQRGAIAIGLLDPAVLGQGLGTEAIRLMCAHAFDTLALHRLGARILDFNARAQKAFAKAGFAEEGREREAARIGANRHDDLLFGLLARDFDRGAS